MKSQHYARIHRRVATRLWSDLPQRTRDIIAADSAHETDEFKWFDSKVAMDANKLYQWPEYYDNSEFSFRVPDRVFRQSV